MGWEHLNILSNDRVTLRACIVVVCMYGHNNLNLQHTQRATHEKKNAPAQLTLKSFKFILVKVELGINLYVRVCVCAILVVMLALD